MYICWPLASGFVLSLAALAHATPLVKRNKCTIQGVEDISTDAFSGGRNVVPSSNAVQSYFVLTYVGGKQIRQWNGNSIALGWHTLPTKDTSLPLEMQWKPVYSVGSFSSCSIKYNGQELKGKPTGGGGGVAETVARCSVDFDCPGNL
jgi:hypothetical protein